MHLTVRVLIAVALGVVVGVLFPTFAVELKFLSDIFLRLIKMVIAPIVFLTISVGVANMGDLKRVGILGAKALVYFELVTTAALAIGLGVVLLVQPGVGFDPSAAHGVDVSKYVTGGSAAGEDFRAFLINMVPESMVGALARGDMLPTLLSAVLFGCVLAQAGTRGAAVTQLLTQLSEIFFGIIALVMRLSPVAAFAAMAFTVGRFGSASLESLARLMVAVYLTMGIFITVVLGSIARFNGFSLLRLLRYIKEELLLVFSTSSSESVLPTLMAKLEAAGCSKSVVGLVVPTGYSFNLDGTAIYLSMATLFIAQAYGIALTWLDMVTILALLMLTSKGAAGVTGSGFVTLGATLSALPGHAIPVEGIVLLVGVDRFMSEARAITNLIGNSVATVVLAKAEGQFKPAGYF